MKAFKTYLVVMAALVAAIAAVPVAQGDNPTPAQLRGMEIRGQAMNTLCADTTLTTAGHRALCGTVRAGNGLTAAQLRGMEIRGQAMNRLCPDSTLSPEANRALCGNAGGGSRLSSAQLQGFETRGQAMNRLCTTKHFASAEASAALCGDSDLVTTATSVQAGVAGAFHWGDFGIGAGAMLGLVLLAGGIVGGLHYGRDRTSVRPRAAS